jgi:NAD(P)H-nitrite reductase large subunit
MATRYLLIGSGAAGLSAAEAIRRHDPSGVITVLSEEPHAFYSRPGLAYYLTGMIPETQLFPRPERDLRELGIQRLNGRALAIDPTAHTVQLAAGGRIAYDRLLLAPGALAVRPKIPGIELEGVVTLDSLDDARRIVRLARRAKRGVVVGGGITALELAEGLAAQGVETHYFLRRERYWGGVLEPEESAWVEEKLEEEGVRLHRNTDLARVVGRGRRVSGVQTADGRTIGCQILAVAVGIRPRLDLAQSAGLACERGIRVDETLRTSDPDIYAAGDAAEVRDPATGDFNLDSLWWIALAQGRVAGENMTGGTSQYTRGVPFNVTRLGGLTTTILGTVGQGGRDDDLVAIARGDSNTWRVPGDGITVESGPAQSRIRILVGPVKIVGAVIMGDQSLSRPLQELIRREVEITPIRQELLARPEQCAGVITRFWRDWSGNGYGPQS